MIECILCPAHHNVDWPDTATTGTGSRQKTVAFAAVPRIGERVEVSGVEFTVTMVSWTDDERDLPIVRLA